MAKTTCPTCDAEIDIPDDPRIGQLVDAMNAQQKTLERYAEKLGELGVKVVAPAPADVAGVTAVKRKKGDVLYEGVFVSYVLDEDEG